MGCVNLIHVPSKATFIGSKSCLGQFRAIFILMGALSGMKVSCELRS